MEICQLELELRIKWLQERMSRPKGSYAPGDCNKEVPQWPLYTGSTVYWCRLPDDINAQGATQQGLT